MTAYEILEHQAKTLEAKYQAEGPAADADHTAVLAVSLEAIADYARAGLDDEEDKQYLLEAVLRLADAALVLTGRGR